MKIDMVYGLLIRVVFVIKIFFFCDEVPCLFCDFYFCNLKTDFPLFFPKYVSMFVCQLCFDNLKILHLRYTDEITQSISCFGLEPVTIETFRIPVSIERTAWP